MKHLEYKENFLKPYMLVLKKAAESLAGLLDAIPVVLHALL